MSVDDITTCERCGMPMRLSSPCECPADRKPETLAKLVTSKQRHAAVEFASMHPKCEAHLGHHTLSHDECVEVIRLIGSSE